MPATSPPWPPQVFARSYSDEMSDGGGYHSPAESTADLGAGFGGGGGSALYSSSKRYSGARGAVKGACGWAMAPVWARFGPWLGCEPWGMGS